MLLFCDCWRWRFSALIITWQYCDDSQMKNNSKAVDSYRYDILWQIIFAIVMIIGILACLLIPENVNNTFLLGSSWMLGCVVIGWFISKD